MAKGGSKKLAIDRNNLLKSSYSPSYSSSSTSIDMTSNNKVTKVSSSGGNSSTLSTKILIELKTLQKDSPNSLIAYYIGIIQLHFGMKNIESMKNAIEYIKASNFRNYGQDLGYIASVMQDKDLSIINENNHLLNPQYYLDFDEYKKLTKINILKEMNYTFASYLLILNNVHWSSTLKLDALKSFLSKEEEYKESNGKYILTAYLNLFSDETKSNLLRLIRRYPIDFKTKNDLLILLSLNETISLGEFTDILDEQESFLTDINSRTENVREKLLQIKKKNSNISTLFNFFYKDERIFSEELKSIRLTKRILEKKEICHQEQELNNKSFLLYMQTLHSQDEKYAQLLEKNIEEFYKIHNASYSKCIRENKGIPSYINNYSSNVKLDKIFIISYLDDLLEEMQEKKELNILMSKRDEQMMELISTMMTCVNNSNECEKIIKLIPSLNYLIEDSLKDFFDEDTFPNILITLSEVATKVYEKNKEEILIGKFSLDEFSKQFHSIFKKHMQSIENLDENSCYLLYASKEIMSNEKYLTKGENSLEHFIGDKYKHLCHPYLESYTQHRDALIYVIKQTVFSIVLKDINVKTDKNILKKILSSYDLRLINLLKPLFYKENTKYLTRRINLYKNDYEPSLINFLVSSYLILSIENKLMISDKKYIALT